MLRPRESGRPQLLVDYDPDALDPEALFQCAEPDAPRSSPSRVRRMGREELVHVAVGGYNNGAKIGNNPLTTPESLPYSTYAEGVGMDTATLNLLLLHLPEASLPWSRYDPHGAGGARMAGVYRTDIVRCMEDAEPTDECIDGYVDTLLRRHALCMAAAASVSAVVGPRCKDTNFQCGLLPASIAPSCSTRP